MAGCIASSSKSAVIITLNTTSTSVVAIEIITEGIQT